ncbi:MAG: HAD family hydrolase [Anaerolineae bacterium]|nr:HAD family hydrolase [Anaerolineae bacterium]
MDLSADVLLQAQIEVINPALKRGRIRYALFDFDGTISLIREGWQSIMIPMMVEILEQTPNHESHALVEQVVKEFVTRLTGKQTVYQMIQLCEEITKRGGEAREPLYYKSMYNERLNTHILERIASLKNGAAKAEDMAVPGAFEWLNILKARGIRCYLASGTDEKYVFEESELLGLPPYFDGIYGAKDDYKNFSKKMVIDQIIQEHHLHGEEFSAYGDGYVEIEDSKSVGGLAIGLATNESERCGIDEWKRSRLIAAGADLIIPDFRCAKVLENYLLGEE